MSIGPQHHDCHREPAQLGWERGVMVVANRIRVSPEWVGFRVEILRFDVTEEAIRQGIYCKPFFLNDYIMASNMRNSFPLEGLRRLKWTES
jgi:hypothetical protein